MTDFYAELPFRLNDSKRFELNVLKDRDFSTRLLYCSKETGAFCASPVQI